MKSTTQHPMDFKNLDTLVESYVTSGRISGCIAAIIDGTDTLHSVISGHQNIETKTLMSWDSIFRIYSMTKPITSIAAMMLWEDGKFNLDDPVANFLPAFSNTQVLSLDGQITPATTPVTVRHILCHTAGMTLPAFSDDHLAPLYKQHDLDGSRSKGSLAEIIDKLGTMPVMYEPGSRWAYSMATDVVGRLIEIWSDTPLEDYLKTRIFNPLGMTDTDFQVDPVNAARMTTNYSVEGEKIGAILDPGTDSRFLSPPEFTCGSGGLTSTAGDYIKFMHMLLKGGSHNGTTLIKAETLELMTQNQLRGDLVENGAGEFNGADWRGIGFGLGFSIVIDSTLSSLPLSLGEYGWTGAAGTVFFINPDLEIGALFLTQYMPSRSYPLRQDFREAVYKDLNE